MKISQQIFIKRWKPILEEYEKIKNKVLPHSFIAVYFFKKKGGGRKFNNEKNYFYNFDINFYNNNWLR